MLSWAYERGFLIMARMTLESLWISASRLAAHRRNYSSSPKRQINQIVPFAGTRTLLFTGSFWGLTENSIHLANILFMDCDITREVVATPTPTVVTTTPVGTQAVPQGTAQQGTTPIPYGGVSNAEPNYSTATHFKVTYNGANYWVRKIDMKKQTCLVRCSCSDYYYVWSHYNYTNGVQFGGASRRYVRKTSTRPEANKLHVVGICKHLAGFSSLLQTSGYAI